MKDAHKAKVAINKSFMHDDAMLYGWTGKKAKQMPDEVHYFLFFECRKPIEQMEIEIGGSECFIHEEDTYLYLDLDKICEVSEKQTEPDYFGSWGSTSDTHSLAEMYAEGWIEKEDIIKRYINEFKRVEA